MHQQPTSQEDGDRLGGGAAGRLRAAQGLSIETLKWKDRKEDEGLLPASQPSVAAVIEVLSLGRTTKEWRRAKFGKTERDPESEQGAAMCFSEIGSHSVASFLSFSMAGIAGVSQPMLLPVTDVNQFYFISLLRLEPGALHLLGKYDSGLHCRPSRPLFCVTLQVHGMYYMNVPFCPART